MLLNQFDKRFPDEDSCIDFFRRIKEPALQYCPKYGCSNFTGQQASKLLNVKNADIMWRDYPKMSEVEDI